MSGFLNSASGSPGANHLISGFFNSATGGMTANGNMSGFFNVGETGPITILGTPFPSGEISGFDSGLANFGTGIAFTTVAL
jgi:hypothetical protein